MHANFNTAANLSGLDIIKREGDKDGTVNRGATAIGEIAMIVEVFLAACMGNVNTSSNVVITLHCHAFLRMML